MKIEWLAASIALGVGDYITVSKQNPFTQYMVILSKCISLTTSIHQSETINIIEWNLTNA